MKVEESGTERKSEGRKVKEEKSIGPLMPSI